MSAGRRPDLGTAVGADGGAPGLCGGLYRQHGRALEPVPLPDGIESVSGIVTDAAGALWPTTNAGVVRSVGGNARLPGDADGTHGCA